MPMMPMMLMDSHCVLALCWGKYFIFVCLTPLLQQLLLAAPVHSCRNRYAEGQHNLPAFTQQEVRVKPA